MSKAQRLPKRFAPLNSAKGNDIGAPALKGIVFDVDGTLCKPQSYMFKQMRDALSIPKSTDILDHIHSLPEPAQSNAHSAIRAIETAAMVEQEPQPGLDELISYLESRKSSIGWFSQEEEKGLRINGTSGPVTHLLQTFLPGKTFAPIVTREFRPPKPEPHGILHIAQAWELQDEGDGLIMVGDSIDDMAAGYRAGCATVLLVCDGNEELKRHEYTGTWIERLDELISMLDGGFEERRRK
ncbi:hypothetical protein MMC21_001728 [Puttea exsequens]|nr:hypothetical protein [Puttea exsequens]